MPLQKSELKHPGTEPLPAGGDKVEKLKLDDLVIVLFNPSHTLSKVKASDIGLLSMAEIRDLNSSNLFHQTSLCHP